MRLPIAVAAVLAVAAAACNERHDEKPAAPRKPPAPVVQRVLDFAARVPPGTRIALRARPEGRVLATIGARTEFGSPQILAVAASQGKWAGVYSPALPNGRLGWVRVGRLQLLGRPVSLEVDLSERELTVHDPGKANHRISVAIGAPETPTPAGEFYVTDKLRGADFGPYYGCCILALSARQPNLPQGWSGGDRLAIHGSPTPTWGHAVSNGCLHADEGSLRYLMKNVLLGTRVVVHA